MAKPDDVQANTDNFRRQSVSELTLRRRIQSVFESIRHSSRPLRFVVGLILLRTRLCRFLRIQMDDYQLHFYPSSVSRMLWVDPAAREEDTRFLRHYLRNDDTCVDVGANIGQLSLTAATAVGPQGYVLAIEAHPVIYSYLQGNLDLNPALRPRVSAMNLAIGERESVITFSNRSNDDMNRVVKGSQGVQVKMVHLDKLTATLPRIDLLKIDVEGYELFVLQGAEETLKRTPCIMIEYVESNFAQYGYPGRHVVEHLERLGYTVLGLIGSDIKRVDPVKLPEGLANLIVVKDPGQFAERIGNAYSLSIGEFH